MHSAGDIDPKLPLQDPKNKPDIFERLLCDLCNYDKQFDEVTKRMVDVENLMPLSEPETKETLHNLTDRFKNIHTEYLKALEARDAPDAKWADLLRNFSGSMGSLSAMKADLDRLVIRAIRR